LSINKGRLYTFPVPANVLPGIPGGNLTASASDYVAISGIRRWTQLVAPTASEPELNDIGQRHGILREVSYDPQTAGLLKQQLSVTDILDGSSNTFMIGELAGRPDVYNARRVVVAQGLNPGAGWGDAFNGEHWPDGTSADGNPGSNGQIPDGPCLMNCSNVQSAGGFYSFHSGGANFIIADGSVRFFSDTTPNRVLVFMITSQRGEVIPTN
jgi:hypothetical protein